MGGVFLFLFVVIFVTNTKTTTNFFLSIDDKLPSVSTGVTPSTSSHVCSTGKQLVAAIRTRRGHLPISVSRIPTGLRGTFVTMRSGHFCRRRNISPLNVVHTIFEGVVDNGTATRKKDAVARRLTQGTFLSRRRALGHGLLRTFLTLGVRQRCAGGRVLRVCVGRVCFKRNYCNVRATSGICFKGSIGSLSLTRYTLVTNLPGDPGCCSPFRDIRTTGRQRSVILSRVIGCKCVARDRTTTTGRTSVRLTQPRRRQKASDITSCFMGCIVRLVDRGCSSSTVCGRNLRVCAALSLSLRGRTRTTLGGGLPGTCASSGGLARPRNTLISVRIKAKCIHTVMNNHKRSRFGHTIRVAHRPNSTFGPFICLATFTGGMAPFSVLDGATGSFNNN